MAKLNEVVPGNNNVPANDGAQLLKDLKVRVQQLLPGFIGPERFLQLVMKEFRRTPKLLQCTKDSLCSALLQSAKEGLEVGEECFLIPRKNKWGKLECVYQRGYVGDLTLARRSGEYAHISAGKVHQNDDYDMVEGTENRLTIRRTFDDRGPVLFYWAASMLRGGESSFTVMSVKEINEHRDKFASTRIKGEISGPWVEHYDSMALKTVLMAHLKYQPRSYDRQRIQAEGAVLTMQDGDTPTLLPDDSDVIDQIEDKADAGPSQDDMANAHRRAMNDIVFKYKDDTALAIDDLKVYMETVIEPDERINNETTVALVAFYESLVADLQKTADVE